MRSTNYSAVLDRAQTTTWPIDQIRVGERSRREMGDIASLAASIAAIGLLHPVVIRPDGTLVAGERRLRAAKLLGWSKIPVTMVDLAAVVRGEFSENVHRKDFTLSEMVAVKRALEPIERAAAKERMMAGKPSEQVLRGSAGNALDHVAKVVGRHRTTIAKAEAVVAAAEAEPARFGKLLADMDRTGRAHGVYKRLCIAQQAEKIRGEPPPLPNRGPYRVAVVDPPWPYEVRDEDPTHRAVLPYPTMSLADISALAVPSILHDDAIVWLWTTNYFMRHAFGVLDAWGLEPKTILTWGKTDGCGYGDWLRGQTEHAIMAVRGKPTVTLGNQGTLLLAPTPRGHSRKPPEFYDLVESLCPTNGSRYADLFSRHQHNGRWDCHGDEAPAETEAKPLPKPRRQK